MCQQCASDLFDRGRMDVNLIGDMLNHWHASKSSSSKDRCTGMFCLREALSRANSGTQLEFESTWTKLLDGGAVRALLDIIQDGYFCGFSKDELTSWSTKSNRYYYEDIIPYIHYATTALGAWLQRSFEYCHDHLVNANEELRHKIMTTVTSVFLAATRFWKALWDIKTPFLDGQLENPPSEFGDLSKPHVVFEGLLDTANEMIGWAEFYGPTIRVARRESHLPHVLLAIWMHSRQDYSRKRALMFLCGALGQHLGKSTGRTLTHFWDAVTADAEGTTTMDRIAKAAVREIRISTKKKLQPDTAMIFQGFVVVIMSANGTLARLLPMESEQERKTIRLMIGWSFTTLCSVDVAPDSDKHSEQVSMMLGFVTTSATPSVLAKDTLAEPDAHALIALISQILPGALERDSKAKGFISHIYNAVTLCRKLVDDFQVRDEDGKKTAEIDVLRYKSVQCWRAGNNALTKNTRAVKAEPSWSSVVRAWSSLGRSLRQYSTIELDDDIVSAFPEQSRCGWAECLCSVYKPVHPLRVCKGCWRVAYCGLKCQTKDWYGGHRKTCKSERKNDVDGAAFF